MNIQNFSLPNLLTPLFALFVPSPPLYFIFYIILSSPFLYPYFFILHNLLMPLKCFALIYFLHFFPSNFLGFAPPSPRPTINFFYLALPLLLHSSCLLFPLLLMLPPTWASECWPIWIHAQNMTCRLVTVQWQPGHQLISVIHHLIQCKDAWFAGQSPHERKSEKGIVQGYQFNS